MPNHVHLLICPNKPDYNVSAILKAIKQPVGTKAIVASGQDAISLRLVVRELFRSSRHGFL